MKSGDRPSVRLGNAPLGAHGPLKIKGGWRALGARGRARERRWETGRISRSAPVHGPEREGATPSPVETCGFVGGRVDRADAPVSENSAGRAGTAPTAVVLTFADYPRAGSAGGGRPSLR